MSARQKHYTHLFRITNLAQGVQILFVISFFGIIISSSGFGLLRRLLDLARSLALSRVLPVDPPVAYLLHELLRLVQDQEAALGEPERVLLPRIVLLLPVLEAAAAVEADGVVALAGVEEAGLRELGGLLLHRLRPFGEGRQARREDGVVRVGGAAVQLDAELLEVDARRAGLVLRGGGGSHLDAVFAAGVFARCSCKKRNRDVGKIVIRTQNSYSKRIIIIHFIK